MIFVIILVAILIPAILCHFNLMFFGFSKYTRTEIDKNKKLNNFPPLLSFVSWQVCLQGFLSFFMYLATHSPKNEARKKYIVMHTVLYTFHPWREARYSPLHTPPVLSVHHKKSRNLQTNFIIRKDDISGYFHMNY